MSAFAFRPDQLKALDLNRGKLVVAGAGSGKTTVLAERYVRLLESGMLPVEIVAMTFTKKAASSLRSKVYANLLQREADQPENARRWRDLRDQMQAARISTIHSFCSSVLHAFPAEARVDPEAAVGPKASISRLQTLRDHLQLLAYQRDDDLRALLGLFASQRQQHVEKVCNVILQNPALQRAIRLAEQDPDRANEYLVDQAQRLRDTFVEEGETAEARPDHREFIRALGHAARVIAPLLPAQSEPRTAIGFDDLEHLTLALLTGTTSAAKQLRASIRALLIDEFQDTSSLQWQIIRELVRNQAGQVDVSKLFLVGDEKQSIYSFRDANVTVVHHARAEFCDNGNAMDLVPLAENFRTRPALLRALNPILARLLRNTKHDGAPFVAQPQELIPGREDDRPGRLDTVFVVEDETDGQSRYVANWIRDNAAGKSESSPAAEGFGVPNAAKPAREPRNSAIRAGEEETCAYNDIAILLKTRTVLPALELQMQLAEIPYTVHGGMGFFARQEVLDLINLISAFADPRDELSRVAVLRGPFFALSDVAVAALFDTRLQARGAWRRWLTGNEEGLLVARLDDEDRWVLNRARSLWRELEATAGRMEPVSWLRQALDRSGAWGGFAVGRRGPQALANIEKFLELVREIVGEQGPGLRELADRLRLEQERADQEPVSEADISAGSGVHVLTMHAAKGLEFPVVILMLSATGQSKDSNLTRGNLLAEDSEFRPLTEPKLYSVARGANAHTPSHFHGVMYHLSAPAEDRAEHLRLLYVAATRARDRLLVVARSGKKRNGDLQVPEDSSSGLWLHACGVDVATLLERCESNEPAVDGVQDAFDLLPSPSGMHFSWVLASSIPEREIRRVLRELAPVPELSAGAGDPQVLIREPGRSLQLQLPLEKFAAWIANPSRQNLDELLHLGGVDETVARSGLESGETWMPGEARPGTSRDEPVDPDLPRLSGTLLHRTIQRFGPGAKWAEVEAWVTQAAGSMTPDASLRIALALRVKDSMDAGVAIEWGGAATARRELPVLLRLNEVSLRGRIDLGWIDGDTAVALDLKTNDVDATAVDKTIEQHGYQHQARLYAMALAASDGVGSAEGRLVFLPAGIEKRFAVTAEDRDYYRAKAAELVSIAQEFHVSAYTRESMK